MKFTKVALLTAAIASLAGCADVRIVAGCAMKSNILIGPCKQKDGSDCAPNYPYIKACKASGNWSCQYAADRKAAHLDPTLGPCPTLEQLRKEDQQREAEYDGCVQDGGPGASVDCNNTLNPNGL